MNESHPGIDNRPWYREMWPWLLMLPPVLSVAGGVTMIYLATQTPNALVVEDYARIEELTSERFERDREASRLALTAELRFERETGQIELSLDAPALVESPAALLLYLRHATNPEADRDVRLVRFGTVYRADVQLASGRYGVELMPEDRAWRLSARPGWLDGRLRLQAQSDGV